MQSKQEAQTFERLRVATDREKNKYTILGEYLILDNGGFPLIVRLQQTPVGRQAAIGTVIKTSQHDEDAPSGNFDHLKLKGKRGSSRVGDVITPGEVRPSANRENYKVILVQPYVRVIIPDAGEFSPYEEYVENSTQYVTDDYGNSLLFELHDGSYMYVGGSEVFTFALLYHTIHQ